MLYEALSAALGRPAEWTIAVHYVRHDSGITLWTTSGFWFFNFYNCPGAPLTLWQWWKLWKAARQLRRIKVAELVIKQEAGNAS